MDTNQFAAFAQQQAQNQLQQLQQQQQNQSQQQQQQPQPHQQQDQQTQQTQTQQQNDDKNGQQLQPQPQSQQQGQQPQLQNDQLLSGMNMSNLANLSQGFQMMQQQNANAAANNPFALMGTNPFQQQLSALSGLTGQFPAAGGLQQIFQQQNGFPQGLQNFHQGSFAQPTQQTQPQVPQQPQQNFFPGGLNTQFLQQTGNAAQQQQPQQQQQQQPQLGNAGGLMNNPQLGLNLQQLQQLMTQQLFAQSGQPGAANGATNGLPAGFNLSALTGMASGTPNNGSIPGIAGNSSLPQQFASLAGAFGNQQLQPQTLNAGTQQVFNPMASMNLPSMQGMNFGFPGLKQDIEQPSALKTSAEIEWAEPFAGKGKKEPPFPLKLHQILSNPEFSECICWNAHGRSWRILKPPVFEQVVIPLYFRHAKYASFMRQVNGWGFKRIVSGNDHNSYYHELFVRELPQLCLKMKRIKKGEADKAKKDDDSEDNQSIENGKDDRSKGNDSGQRQNEEQGSDESGNGNKQNQVQNQQQPSFNMGPNTNLAYQGLQNVGALSQTLNPTGGNDVALNFLKASGFPLQGLMGNQAPNMGAVNGQNFLQGLINAGGASNNLQGFNFGHPGAAFANNGIAPQGGTPLNIQTMPNQATNGMQNSTTNETQSQISSGEQAAAQNGPVDQGGNNGGIGGNVFAGIDSATLAKLQEALAAAGGGNNFLQSQQQANANSSLPNTNTNGSNNANAFASLLNNQLGGQNASLLASQLQAASQPAQQNSSEESELKTDQ